MVDHLNRHRSTLAATVGRTEAAMSVSRPGQDLQPIDDPGEPQEGVAGLHVVRDEVLESLGRLEAPLVILSGPSGAGKSDLLGQWQLSDNEAISPAPTSLDWSAGAVQRAVIAQIAAAAAELTRDQAAVERVAQHLEDAARRLAASAALDIAKVVGKEILAVLKGRLGPTVGDALGEYIHHLKDSYDERLEQRLASAADPGAVRALITFAGEVATLAGGRRVALALDNVDRLGEADAHALLDLVEGLPSQVRLRAAFAVDRGGYRQLDRLRSAGGEEFSVPPFSLHEIQSLLAQAGLSPSLGQAVLRVTSGHALTVHDLVAHLSQGGELAETPRNEQFARRTREAWNTLEPVVAAIARRLAVYPAPMGVSETAQLLGLELHGWSEAREQLLRAGLFSKTAGGEFWFHEQRRRYVWEDILNEDERAASASAAVRVLGDAYQKSGRLEILPMLAHVATRAPSDSLGDEGVRAVLQLQPDEVAVLAALMELQEPPPGTPAVLGDTLLQYARNAFARTADLVPALEHLVELELVFVVSREDAVAAVSRLPDGLAALVLAGRASNELGRMPIPSAASTFFQLELRPRLGPFDFAVYGVGRASMGHLGREVRDAQRKRPDGQFNFGPPAPALLIRAIYDSIDVYSGVTFASKTQRENANTALHTVDPGEGRLAILDVIEHPCTAIPSQRFLSAASLLTGGDYAHSLSGPRLDTPIGVVEGAERRYQTEELLRELCSPLELLAYQLDQPRRYVAVPDLAGSTGGLLVEVLGISRPVEVRRSVATSPFARDPYAHFRLAHELGLGTGESFGLLRYMSAGFSDDPIIDLLIGLKKAARDFNGTASRVRVRLTADDLATRVQEAVARRWRDAEALAPVLPPASATQLRPIELELFVRIGRPEPNGPRISNEFVGHRSRPGRGDEPVVRVHIEEQPADMTSEDWYRTSADWLQRDSGSWHLVGDGDAHWVIADLLGFDPQELRLDL